eukprot:8158894-Ditylum_brightwellii.AAC.1
MSGNYADVTYHAQMAGVMTSNNIVRDIGGLVGYGCSIITKSQGSNPTVYKDELYPPWEFKIKLPGIFMTTGHQGTWNNVLHADMHDPDIISTLNTEICKAYGSLQHQMDNFDQRLFSKPLDNQLCTTPQSKKHWLVAVHIAVHDFTKVHGQLPSQLTITSFLQKRNTPCYNSTMSPQSMSCTSMSRIIDPVLRASEDASSWEDDDFWADPAGDFELLFERGKGVVAIAPPYISILIVKRFISS